MMGGDAEAHGYAAFVSIAAEAHCTLSSWLGGGDNLDSVSPSSCLWDVHDSQSDLTVSSFPQERALCNV